LCREQLLNRKWQIIYGELASKKIINCTKVVELRNTGITCIKLRRTKSGIYNYNWGGGSGTVMIRINMYSNRIAPLQMVILALWTEKTRC
jgi:hypothetical protein